MSDDDNRRGPRGPRKPGGPFKAGGPRKPAGPRKPPGADRASREGGAFAKRDFAKKDFGKGGFGASRSGDGASRFRDEPRPERPARSRSEGFGAGGGRSAGPPSGGFRDEAPRQSREDRPPRGTGGFRDAPPARDRFSGEERPQRRFRDGDRPERAPRAFGEDKRPPRAFNDDRRAPRDFSRDDRGPRSASQEDRPRTSSRPERRPSLPRGGNPERLATPEKEGGVERIAKVIARAGAASRREAEEMIADGRVTVDGVAIQSPALDVPPTARIAIDGEPLPARERTRLWLYHKPAGLVSTNHDPEGRTTLFERLPEDLPRVITVGRLDINTEGLLLLTNDGGLARVLGHPETAWLRRYRVRAYGQITQDKLDAVRGGLTIDGENFGPVIATRDRETGDNTWLTVDLREGKNREVKRVLEHLGLVVNRLIRISFGPFQLGDLAEGEVEEVRTRVLRDQLGEQLAAIAGVDFDAPVRNENRLDRPHPHEEGRAAPSSRPVRGAARFGADSRPRSASPGEAEDGPPPRRPREGAYHRAREERGDAPRDILLRAEEGRGAIWRDEDTTVMKPRRTGPRRGADPREERAARDAAGTRERVRVKPIEDPKGRRVTVERVTGASPDLPRKPRYTRADFAAPSGEARPFRRSGRDDRPRDADSERPARRSAERSFRPRDDRRPAEGFKPRGPRKEFGDRPPPRDGERGARPRGDAPRKEGPRKEGFRSEGFRSEAPRGEGRGGFADRPPGKRGPKPGGAPRSGPPRSGPPRSGPSRGGPSRGGAPSGGDRPRGPRKPRG